MPSLVAVIVTVPDVKTVTRPDALTDATVGADDVNVVARPVIGVPSAAAIVVVNCTVVPVAAAEAAGDSEIVATGANGATVTFAVAVFPSVVRLIVAVPKATPVSKPVLDTVTTVGADDVNVKGRPRIKPPLASVVAYTNCTLWPGGNTPLSGTMLAVEIGELPTIAAKPLTLSTLAKIDVDPALSTVTKPVAETVAMVGSADDHTKFLPDTAPPATSNADAASCCVAPIRKSVTRGVTAMLDTVLAGSVVLSLHALNAKRAVANPSSGAPDNRRRDENGRKVDILSRGESVAIIGS